VHSGEDARWSGPAVAPVREKSAKAAATANADTPMHTTDVFFMGHASCISVANLEMAVDRARTTHKNDIGMTIVSA
jgi:hypothetical protein